MMVVPEGGSTFMHNMTMIVDGHTGIEHTLPVQTAYDDVMDLWRGTSVGYTPTLSVATVEFLVSNSGMNTTTCGNMSDLRLSFHRTS